MNAEFKAKWIAALLSNKYKQGKDCLRSVDDHYCCLGVLCDIIAPTEWSPVYDPYRKNEVEKYKHGVVGDQDHNYLPKKIRKMTDISSENERILSLMNDSGKPFAIIAQHIADDM